MAGIERPTIVTFAEENTPPVIGKYTLEGALLVVDPVRQRLAPTHALRYGQSTTQDTAGPALSETHTTKTSNTLNRITNMVRNVVIAATMGLLLAVMLVGCSLSRSGKDIDVYWDYLDQSFKYIANGQYEEAIMTSSKAIDLYP